MLLLTVVVLEAQGLTGAEGGPNLLCEAVTETSVSLRNACTSGTADFVRYTDLPISSYS